LSVAGHPQLRANFGHSIPHASYDLEESVIRSFRGKQGPMRDALLLNPFSSVPEAAPRRKAQAAATRVTPICSSCQSDDIVSNALVQWSNEMQEWQIADTFGQPAYCNGCRNACTITWLPVD
jgi:hypothetical protein